MMGIVFAFYLDGRLGVSVIVMGGKMDDRYIRIW